MTNFDQTQPIRPRSEVRFRATLGSVESIPLQSNAETNRLHMLAAWGHSWLYPPANAAALVSSLTAPGSLGLVLGVGVALAPVLVGLPVVLAVTLVTVVLQAVFRDSPQTKMLLGFRLLSFVLPLLLGFICAL